MSPSVDRPAAREQVSWREALGVWLRVAAQSFGGPAGQIGVMHRLLVEEKRWMGERRFLHALSFCMLLPGPEAQQLATYCGWLMHRVRGGLLAGGLFVLPGFLSILALSVLYVNYLEVLWVEALFYGLKAGVLAVVAGAVWTIGRKTLETPFLLAIAAFAFVALFLFDVSFPVVLITAMVAGWLASRWAPGWLRRAEDSANDETEGELAAPDVAVASIGRTLRVAIIWLAVWLVPVIALRMLLAPDHIFVLEATFFSKVALVTFGGAYAALAFTAQQGVGVYGWLSASEMLDGLGMAETTPGPLIQVLQFVGFLAAYRQPGGLDPLLAGVLGSILTTWMIFAPCFLWIFVGAPWIERLRGVGGLSGALRGATAGVVGVMLNLALWFGMHVIFRQVDERNVGALRLLVPDLSNPDFVAFGIALAALWGLQRRKWSLLPTLFSATLIGALSRLLLA
jgi:chromate transporter